MGYVFVGVMVFISACVLGDDLLRVADAIRKQPRCNRKGR